MIKGKTAGKVDKHGIRTELDMNDEFGAMLAQYETASTIESPNGGKSQYAFMPLIEEKFAADGIFVNDKPRTIFRLTNSQAVRITMPRLEHLRAQFPDIAIGDAQVENGSLNNGIKVVYEVETPDSVEPQQIAFEIRWLYTTFKSFNSEKLVYDTISTKAAIQLLAEKYGTNFKAKYFYSKIGLYHKMAMRSGKVEKSAKALNRELAYIGKYAPNAEELIFQGKHAFDYSQLEDLQPQEDEEI